MLEASIESDNALIGMQVFSSLLLIAVVIVFLLIILEAFKSLRRKPTK